MEVAATAVKTLGSWVQSPRLTRLCCQPPDAADHPGEMLPSGDRSCALSDETVLASDEMAEPLGDMVLPSGDMTAPSGGDVPAAANLQIEEVEATEPAAPSGFCSRALLRKHQPRSRTCSC